jgi:hypothetical protein
LRKLPKKATKAYLPEGIKLLDVPKEWEGLSSSGTSSDAVITEGHSDDAGEETSN